MKPSLLLRAGVRYHQRHWLQSALAVVGIALGVAVVTAIDLANESANRAFSLSAERLAGSATHQVIGGPSGLPEDFFQGLRMAGVRPSAPVVEGYATVGSRTFQFLGIDPFSERAFHPRLAVSPGTQGFDLQQLLTEPNTVLMARETLEELGLSLGERLQARIGGLPQALTVAGTLPAGDPLQERVQRSLLVADIATAQEVFGMVGRLSHIDLILSDRETATVEALLPPGAELVPASNRAAAMTEMTRAFRTNLTALSLLALVVGMFLIYNTMNFAVVQRRQAIGMLRALGATQREIFGLFLREALLFGLVGTVLGIVAGILMAQGLLRLVTRTINDIYFVLTVTDFFLTPLSLLKGLLLGMIATLFSAWIPALSATRSAPGPVMSRSLLEERHRRYIPRAALIGIGVMSAGAILLAIPSGNLLLGFAALFALIIGYSLLVPFATVGLMTALGRLVRSRPLMRLATRGVTASLSRTAVALAALTLAVSTIVGVGIMVDSFRSTVAQWLHHTLRADIYLAVAGPFSERRSTPLSEEVLSAVRETRGVSHISTYREVTVSGPLGSANLAILGAAPESYRGYQFKGTDRQRAINGFRKGAVLISEAFAHRHELTADERIVLNTDKGPQSFAIAGIFYDYGSDRGIVHMARETYERFWNDEIVTALGIYKNAGTTTEDLLARLEERLSRLQTLNIRSNEALREASFVVFDRTFAITRVLRLLAMIVAFIGILSALMALQLERAREFAILRATGMTPWEVYRLVTVQTGLMGGVAGVLSLPLGIVLASVLIQVINRRAFGWTLNLELPGGIFLQVFVLACGAAILAGLYPAWRMANANPAQALREE